MIINIKYSNMLLYPFPPEIMHRKSNYFELYLKEKWLCLRKVNKEKTIYPWLHATIGLIRWFRFLECSMIGDFMTSS